MLQNEYDIPITPNKSRPAYEVIDHESVSRANSTQSKRKVQQEDTYARLDKARMEIQSNISNMPDGLYAALGKK
jgi:hypothetical protein